MTGRMAMRKNLTLSLDEDLLHQARMVCQKRKTTLTQVIREFLEKLAYQDEEHKEAWRFIQEKMQERPIRVGTKTWTREELHER
jgi:antitoxin component of RelBE/YafQ-DinJ toxin-antitoxin module